MLATIQAIARRTRAKSQNLDEFAKAFEDRLAAIARTHALLSRTHTSTIDIREVLSQELSVHGAVEGENLKQRGPAISIPAKQAEVLSMQYTSSPQTPLNTALSPWRTVILIYRGTLMTEAMKMSSNSAGASGRAPSRTSRPGGASVQSFSRNRYHICCTGDSSECWRTLEAINPIGAKRCSAGQGFRTPAFTIDHRIIGIHAKQSFNIASAVGV